ncbi:MAG: MBL fold metallo-hydrolase [Anaerolineaceae bacterium]|jgi:L-ascorbate metabolism protein UlaG (beta-lactamase superfamily)|nr:MBL fold metallo-hydrolase [Anaerolineaceae bacterium]
MEITWHGNSCFRINERGMASVVTDPYDPEVVGIDPGKLRAEVVTVSCDNPGHNFIKGIRGKAFEITGPGEYEIGGVFITGVRINGSSRKKTADDVPNTVYVIDYNGLKIAHLGELNNVPSQTEVEGLGEVHVALVPVGGSTSLNAAKAAEVISLLEPSIVIPMHYSTGDSALGLEPLAKFLKEMGLTQVDTEQSIKLGSVNTLPEETHVMVLDLSL